MRIASSSEVVNFGSMSLLSNWKDTMGAVGGVTVSTGYGSGAEVALGLPNAGTSKENVGRVELVAAMEADAKLEEMGRGAGVKSGKDMFSRVEYIAGSLLRSIM